jgi:hypothetical protein
MRDKACTDQAVPICDAEFSMAQSLLQDVLDLSGRTRDAGSAFSQYEGVW